ncbi:DUF4215 domain-containing protein [Nannocystis radixulma]|uniref:DUF4215 domain-containing protein n=1 Tax=Nannocystis radixulma TaxID=2995305 RepID=A0ABT5BPK3_9BACT|nr:DUF4215 domain-containing protein [Nannocystis radixulma]MDC0676097.1 DUF4215 domain-containing protein [Nannocystis radixulma]
MGLFAGHVDSNGNAVDTDACVGACKPAACGDGFVQADVEECDDANASDTDACVSGCKAAKCGDGFVQAGSEECDDGNASNNDACNNLCKAPMCGNGIVDGSEECDDANADNQDGCDTSCVAIRAKVMICGNTVRPVSTFFPAGYNWSVSSSCAPDAETQALFITRSWGGGIGAAALQAYLNAGGIVLTEYNTSDKVWSLAFGATAQGGFNGNNSCRDTMPAVVQFNPGDKVWTKVPFVANALNQTGCGFAVGGFAGITTLTGWNANAAATGYRDLGLGRLWATDFDWQDNEMDQSFTFTNAMMGYFMTHRK